MCGSSILIGCLSVRVSVAHSDSPQPSVLDTTEEMTVRLLERERGGELYFIKASNHLNSPLAILSIRRQRIADVVEKKRSNSY